MALNIIKLLEAESSQLVGDLTASLRKTAERIQQIEAMLAVNVGPFSSAKDLTEYSNMIRAVISELVGEENLQQHLDKLGQSRTRQMQDLEQLVNKEGKLGDSNKLLEKLIPEYAKFGEESLAQIRIKLVQQGNISGSELIALFIEQVKLDLDQKIKDLKKAVEEKHAYVKSTEALLGNSNTPKEIKDVLEQSIANIPTQLMEVQQDINSKLELMDAVLNGSGSYLAELLGNSMYNLHMINLAGIETDLLTLQEALNKDEYTQIWIAEEHLEEILIVREESLIPGIVNIIGQLRGEHGRVNLVDLLNEIALLKAPGGTKTSIILDKRAIEQHGVHMSLILKKVGTEETVQVLVEQDETNRPLGISVTTLGDIYNYRFKNIGDAITYVEALGEKELELIEGKDYVKWTRVENASKAIHFITPTGLRKIFLALEHSGVNQPIRQDFLDWAKELDVNNMDFEKLAQLDPEFSHKEYGTYLTWALLLEIKATDTNLPEFVFDELSEIQAEVIRPELKGLQAAEGRIVRYVATSKKELINRLEALGKTFIKDALAELLARVSAKSEIKDPVIKQRIVKALEDNIRFFSQEAQSLTTVKIFADAYINRFQKFVSRYSYKELLSLLKVTNIPVKEMKDIIEESGLVNLLDYKINVEEEKVALSYVMLRALTLVEAYVPQAGVIERLRLAKDLVTQAKLPTQMLEAAPISSAADDAKQVVRQIRNLAESISRADDEFWRIVEGTNGLDNITDILQTEINKVYSILKSLSSFIAINAQSRTLSDEDLVNKFIAESEFRVELGAEASSLLGAAKKLREGESLLDLRFGGYLDLAALINPIVGVMVTYAEFEGDEIREYKLSELGIHIDAEGALDKEGLVELCKDELRERLGLDIKASPLELEEESIEMTDNEARLLRISQNLASFIAKHVQSLGSLLEDEEMLNRTIRLYGWKILDLKTTDSKNDLNVEMLKALIQDLKKCSLEDYQLIKTMVYEPLHSEGNVNSENLGYFLILALDSTVILKALEGLHSAVSDTEHFSDPQRVAEFITSAKTVAEAYEKAMIVVEKSQNEIALNQAKSVAMFMNYLMLSESGRIEIDIKDVDLELVKNLMISRTFDWQGRFHLVDMDKTQLIGISSRLKLMLMKFLLTASSVGSNYPTGVAEYNYTDKRGDLTKTSLNNKILSLLEQDMIDGKSNVLKVDNKEKLYFARAKNNGYVLIVTPLQKH